jgi:hypothetical protein
MVDYLVLNFETIGDPPKAGIAVRANDSETQTPLEFRPYGAEG